MKARKSEIRDFIVTEVFLCRFLTQHTVHVGNQFFVGFHYFSPVTFHSEPCTRLITQAIRRKVLNIFVKKSVE